MRREKVHLFRRQEKTACYMFPEEKNRGFVKKMENLKGKMTVLLSSIKVYLFMY